MKAIKAPLLAVLVLGLLFPGQTEAAEKSLAFGVKGALVFAQQWSSTAEGEGYTVDPRIKTRCALGAFADIRLSERFHLQPEILFSRKGSRQDVTIEELEIGAVRTDFFLDYIEIPVVLKMYPFKRGDWTNLFICAGAYGAYLAASEFKFSNAYIGEFTQDLEDLTDTDFGLVLGTGLEIDSLGRRWSFCYRFTWGLTDLTLPTGPGFPEIELRNQCHSLTLELRLF